MMPPSACVQTFAQTWPCKQAQVGLAPQPTGKVRHWYWEGLPMGPVVTLQYSVA